MGKTKDITGQRFGRLVAIENTQTKQRGYSIWLCKCDCGEFTKVSIFNLSKGDVKSCGCSRRMELNGQRFGRLLVLNNTYQKAGNGSYLWLCQCDCGKETTASAGSLRGGNKQSCGCLSIESSNKNVLKADIFNTEIDSKEQTRLSLLNQKKSKNNTSGIKGVCFDKQTGNWIAHMAFQRKTVLNKRFKNKQDAINARKEAEEKYFKPILEKYGKGNDGNETVQISKQGKS
ncbi:hypothetical protein SDC9_66757 [bioreactor metagenome]|uniref:AP2/ERF domain-containing protein n=1 Tax=bioreactor metagenome TaxID=1076179 RepID=A0A644XX11_9ZZZZ